MCDVCGLPDPYDVGLVGDALGFQARAFGCSVDACLKAVGAGWAGESVAHGGHPLICRTG